MIEKLGEIRNWCREYPIQFSILILSFMAYPLAIISPQGVTLFREIFLYKLPLELLTSSLAIFWLLYNCRKLSINKALIVCSGIFLLSVFLSFFLNDVYIKDLIISLQFIAVLFCMAFSYSKKEYRNGGLLLTCILFSLFFLINIFN